MENVTSADSNRGGIESFCYSGEGYRRMLPFFVCFVQKQNKKKKTAQQDISVLIGQVLSLVLSLSLPTFFFFPPLPVGPYLCASGRSDKVHHTFHESHCPNTSAAATFKNVGSCVFRLGYPGAKKKKKIHNGNELNWRAYMLLSRMDFGSKQVNNGCSNDLPWDQKRLQHKWVCRQQTAKESRDWIRQRGGLEATLSTPKFCCIWHEFLCTVGVMGVCLHQKWQNMVLKRLMKEIMKIEWHTRW